MRPKLRVLPAIISLLSMRVSIWVLLYLWLRIPSISIIKISALINVLETFDQVILFLFILFRLRFIAFQINVIVSFNLLKILAIIESYLWIKIILLNLIFWFFIVMNMNLLWRPVCVFHDIIPVSDEFGLRVLSASIFWNFGVLLHWWFRVLRKLVILVRVFGYLWLRILKNHVYYLNIFVWISARELHFCWGRI